MTTDPRFAATARSGAVLSAVVAAGLAISYLPASAAGPAPSRSGSAPPAARPAAEAQPAPAQPEQDTASRSVAARARTNECGHQWNNMKRAGTTAGATWKEFFRGCQAQK